MSKITVYKCDICREQHKKNNIYGVRFTNMTIFKLSDPDSTDGIHICKLCLKQIFELCSDANEIIDFEYDHERT